MSNRAFSIIKQIKEKLFLVKIKDFGSFVLLFLSLPYALFIKLSGEKIWVICEQNDNGYALFKYMQENVQEVNSYYAITSKSPDFYKLKKYKDNLIEFGSFKHIAYYLACEANISSVKNSSPNNLMGFVFRKLNIMNNKMIFLQHGTIINDCKWLHYPETKFRMFCCGAIPEYKYVSAMYEYPQGHVVYNGGQCRFDLLHQQDNNEKRSILIMPTWRKWLKCNDPQMEEIEGTKIFEDTNYYNVWRNFLTSSKIKELSENYDVKFIFYPHPTMQNYIASFSPLEKYVVIANEEEFDIQYLIRTSQMLVTDYSSVLFDYVYMGKPIAMYQFDYDDFRKYHYAEGYFSYSKNFFSKSFTKEDEVFEYIENAIKNSFAIDNTYMQEREKYFPIYDANNCRRTYENIKKIFSYK